jgi:hypothetical protein
MLTNKFSLNTSDLPPNKLTLKINSVGKFIKNLVEYFNITTTKTYNER